MDVALRLASINMAFGNCTPKFPTCTRPVYRRRTRQLHVCVVCRDAILVRDPSFLCFCNHDVMVDVSAGLNNHRPETARRKGPGFHCLRMR